MILCQRVHRDTRYTTYLLATGHKDEPLPDNPTLARRAVSGKVFAFKDKWEELFGPVAAARDGDWYDTWIDYNHWLESERLYQMMLEGLPDDTG